MKSSDLFVLIATFVLLVAFAAIITWQMKKIYSQYGLSGVLAFLAVIIVIAASVGIGFSLNWSSGIPPEFVILP